MTIAFMLGLALLFLFLIVGAVNNTDYSTSLTYNTDRGWSMSIWNDARISDYLENPSLGFLIGTDWCQTPATASTSGGSFLGGFGQFAVFLSQGGTITNSTSGAPGGEIVLGSDGDDEAATLASTNGSILISTKGGSGHAKVWFECRVKVSTIAATQFDAFWGLTKGITPSAVIPITATAGQMADIDFIGFQRDATVGNNIQFTYKANGQTVQKPITALISATNSAAAALVADTYVKLGFKYDRNAPPEKRITIFVNGMEYTTTYITETNIAAATFPSTVSMGLCSASVNATGTTPGTRTEDWIFAAAEFAQ